MKKILSIIIIFFLFFGSIYSQKKKVFISDFSDLYSVEIKIKKQTFEGFYSGTIKILNKYNKNVLIELDNNKISLNTEEDIIDLKYDNQKIIVYDDFNFDNRKDFAILDSQSGAYGSPTYNIYLYQNGKFEYNKEFTKLAHQYTGLFKINTCNNEIIAFKKSGCCYSEKTTFLVLNNKPVPDILIEDYADENNNVKRTIKKMVEGKWKIVSKSSI